MKKKQVLVLTLLAFGISMVLVGIVHLLTGSGSFLKQASISNLNPTLASTITLKNKKSTLSKIAGSSTSLPGNAFPSETADIDPNMLSTTEDPNLAYPGPGIDEDHLPGSEPSDSEGSFDINDLNGTEDTSGIPDSNPSYDPPPSYGGSYPAPSDPIDPPGPEPADSDSGWEDPNQAPEPTAVQESPTAAVPTTPAAASPTTPAAASTFTVVSTATAPVPTLVPAHTQAPDQTPTSAAAPTQAPTAAPTEPPAQPTAPAIPAENALVSVPASQPPALDGNNSDAVWANAPALTIQTHGGANQSATRVMVQSAYDAENIYFFLTWSDPTQSFLRNPWEKQPDGSWKMLTDPNDKGSDDSLYYEDKISLLWPTQAGSTDANLNQGCGGACHSGENADVKPFGNMYLPDPDAISDLWQWKSVRNVGQVDDQYMNGNRFSKDNPAAGFHSDPSDGGGYAANQTEDKQAPMYMSPNGGSRDGAPGWILQSEKTPLDDSLFQPGNRVPSILVEPFTGDRGDISAQWRYQNGLWMVELSRKRATGSNYDVQFDSLDRVYRFDLATFDNTQQRHAVTDHSSFLTFQK
jgi:hypothetical protein